MQKSARQLSALEPDARCEIVEIRGIKLEVRPLPVSRMPAFLEHAEPVVSAIGAGPGGLEGFGFMDWLRLVKDHKDHLVQAVATALDEDPQDVANLHDAEILELLVAIVGVNLDFSTRQVIPAVGRLAQLFLGLASRLSSSGLNKPSRS